MNKNQGERASRTHFIERRRHRFCPLDKVDWALMRNRPAGQLVNSEQRNTYRRRDGWHSSTCVLSREHTIVSQAIFIRCLRTDKAYRGSLQLIEKSCSISLQWGDDIDWRGKIISTSSMQRRFLACSIFIVLLPIPVNKMSRSITISFA